MIILSGLVARLKPRKGIRESVAAISPIAMATQIMVIYLSNVGAAADQYQYLAIMIVVYMNINQRLGFRYALTASLVIIAIYAVALTAGYSPAATRGVGLGLIIAATYLSLQANWRMERDARYAFLRRLHDRFIRDEAEQLAHRDALTGLANRRLLDTNISDRDESEQTLGTEYAVLMLDVDHFKEFNDTYGHPSGDLCLKRIAGAIVSELRDENDLAVRYGGEEFLVLLNRGNVEDAIRLGERIRRRVEGLAIPHNAPASHGGVVTISVGAMAGKPQHYRTAELIAGADSALYTAKVHGRNRVWPALITGSEPTPINVRRNSGAQS